MTKTCVRCDTLASPEALALGRKMCEPCLSQVGSRGNSDCIFSQLLVTFAQVIKIIWLVSTIAILGIVVAVFGTPKQRVAYADTATAVAEHSDLKDQIGAIYEKSARECGQSYRGQEGCVKAQFALNYSYYILKDQSAIGGPPGVPGSMSGSQAIASTPNRAEGLR